MNLVAADMSRLMLNRRNLSRLTSAATSLNLFMVPMHAKKRKTPALPNTRARCPRHYFAAQVHGPNARPKNRGGSPRILQSYGQRLRMKTSASAAALGARNLFRSGCGRTEVRAPVGLQRCRSEGTASHQRVGISKSPVELHSRGNRNDLQLAFVISTRFPT